jgi:OOP family OmpA-OmpF porin
MKHTTALCVLALASLPAMADETGQWYFTPQVGYVWTDGDRSAEDDWLYGLSIGKHVSERWSTELNFNRTKPDVGAASLTLDALSLDFLRVFNRDASSSPFLSFGAGAIANNFDPGPYANDFLAQVGFGFFMRHGNFTFRPEIKVRRDDAGAQGNLIDYIASLGFQFNFGGAAPAPAPTPPPAPAPAPAVEPAPPPPPAPVVPPPPADTDGDGVIDPKDKCPGTPRGVAVDADGCPRKGSITLEGVTFELNKADLTVDSRPVLDRVAEDLRKFPRLRIELQGHTDSSGSDKYNMSLSQRRADSVAQYLIDAGIPSSQVTAKGYGESEPIADNTTDAGRAQNRRVVMKVLDNPGEVDVKGEGQL